MDNIKLIHRSGWTFFTTPRGGPLKSDRMASVSRDGILGIST